MENDVNCAALGEKVAWSRKGKKDFICVTIGTGIGGGIVINDDILRGDTCVAGEFGHIQIIKNGLECMCGKKGCYERYASATALVRMVKEKTGLEIKWKRDIYKRKSWRTYIQRDSRRMGRLSYRWVKYYYIYF